jgi:hypothetical protein
MNTTNTPPPNADSDQIELRDLFAAEVMTQVWKLNPKGHKHGWDGMASLAYAYADAMLRVRETRK